MNDERELLAIVNPAAGNGRGARRATPLLERLGRSRKITVRHTEKVGDAFAWAAEASRQSGSCDIIAVGGDGTAFEIVNGVCSATPGQSAERRPGLAMLPVGTGNSMVHDLAPEGADEVLGRLLGGHSRPVDVLRVDLENPAGEPEHLWALGNLSLGFAVEVVQATEERLKGLGVFGYTAGVFAALHGLSPTVFDLGCDGEASEEHAALLVSISNNPTLGGNMTMSPGARVDDGVFDLIEVLPVGRFELLRAFPRIFRGTHLRHPRVRHRQAAKFLLDTRGVTTLLIDGELRRGHIKNACVEPAAINLMF